MQESKLPEAYKKLPLEQWTITDLTDALSIPTTKELLGTSARVIYTIRHTNAVGYDRYVKLIDAVKADEANCRARLVTLRSLRAARRTK